MRLYFISGLGVDKRVFQKLRFPSQINIQHLDWIEPLPKESLPVYALRLAKGIDTSSPFGLVGISFGGMIATEIAKVLSPAQVILISSASTPNELPKLYRLLGALHLQKLLPASLLKLTNIFTYWLFDARTNEEKALLKEIIKDTDPRFLKWAITSIIDWKNKVRPLELYHIHGTSDKIIPVKNVKADKLIKGGGHLMVFSHALQVADVIFERLAQTKLSI